MSQFSLCMRMQSDEWFSSQRMDKHLDISFQSKRLRQTFNSEHSLTKKYGKGVSRVIMIRMAVLRNARSLDLVPKTPPERCHQLIGSRTGQFAVDLGRSLRLVFKPNHEKTPRLDDGGIDLNKVTAIDIIEVSDYH